MSGANQTAPGTAKPSASGSDTATPEPASRPGSGNSAAQPGEIKTGEIEAGDIETGADRTSLPEPHKLSIPELSLVVLVGSSGSGKSTFAQQHFAGYEVLSSDTFRGMVSNDEEDHSATPAAFEALNFVAAKRLEAGLLTVIDATSVQPEARKQLVTLAREHDVLPVAIVFDLPTSVSVDRNTKRHDRSIPAPVVKRQVDQLRRGLRGLGKEGFRAVHVLHTTDDVAGAVIVREPLLTDRRYDHGPFDVIGDVHGCLDELSKLLGLLGYVIKRDDTGRAVDATHPEGRRVIFVGDLVDRGPDVVGVLRLAMGMVTAGHALAVPGNHEDKLQRALAGRKVTTSHGLAETLTQLAAEGSEFQAEVRRFCYDLVSHLVLDDGKLVVAHAGLKEAYQGRASGRVRAFALYGETTGETDEFGLPVRYPWAQDYRGTATVLYGHTPTPTVEWVNNTACLDTGCVFGGALSAMRYPEREVVQVPAERVYYQPSKPFLVEAPTAEAERTPGIMSLGDVQGRLVVDLADGGRITIKEEQTAGALEVMSRFAIDPRWLVYLPPTMSPPASAKEPGFLEHPSEAFSYFREQGVTDVVCEEKHMGSRAVILLSRNPARFGAPSRWRGVIHTRTGRAFFPTDREHDLLTRIDAAVERAGLWQESGADWLLLDTEIMPWGLKAGELIRDLYASLAASGVAATNAATRVLDQALASGLDVRALRERAAQRAENAARFRDAYRRYVGQDDELRIAPFQLLAAGTETFERRDHGWHLGIADRLVAADEALFTPTRRLRVDLEDASSISAAIAWWTELTKAGGEGMVVKPWANLVHGKKGTVQPGIKVRGREYLRIIYGPDYLVPENVSRLRDRDTGHKRSLASREYALGLEAVRRATANEPAWRVHEAVFGVLALESDPIDPRL